MKIFYYCKRNLAWVFEEWWSDVWYLLWDSLGPIWMFRNKQFIIKFWFSLWFNLKYTTLNQLKHTGWKRTCTWIFNYGLYFGNGNFWLIYLDINPTSFQKSWYWCNTGSLLKGSGVHILWQIQQVSTTCIVTIWTGFAGRGTLSPRGTCKIK